MFFYKKLRHKDGFEILNNLSSYTSLVQLMENPGNFSHAVTISGVYIFDINYEMELPVIKYSLDVICEASDRAYVAEKFQKFYV